MATKTYTKYVLTGGGTGALDAIDGDVLANDYRAIVITDDNAYHYILDATSGETEDGFNVIAPDSNAGTKRWILRRGSESADGFYPYYNAADQGVTGSNNTIKYYVDQISTDKGTIVLRHNSDGATTTYDLDTSETIPSNITLKFEHGAIIDGVTGNETLTINGGIEAGMRQIFGSSLTVAGSPQITQSVPQWFDNDFKKWASTWSVPKHIPSGTYTYDKEIVFTGDTVLTYGDVTLDFSAASNAGNFDEAGIYFDGGDLVALPGLNSNVDKSANSLVFDSAPSVEEGDVLIIYNDTNSSWHGSRTYYRAGEFVRVRTVSSSTANLYGGTFDSYTAADVDVYKVPGNSFNASGGHLHIIASDSLNDLTCMQVLRAVDSKIENVSGSNSGNACIALFNCYNISGDNLSPRQNEAAGLGTNYGVVIGNSQKIRIVGDLYADRHALTTGGGDFIGCVPCREVSCKGSFSNPPEASVKAVDCHGNTEYFYAEGVFNGGINPGGDNTTWRGRINVSDGSDGVAVYFASMLGWNHDLSGLKIDAPSGDPTDIGRGTIDLGGDSSSADSDTTRGGVLRLSNIIVSAPESERGITIRNRGSAPSEPIIIDVSNTIFTKFNNSGSDRGIGVNVVSGNNIDTLYVDNVDIPSSDIFSISDTDKIRGWKKSGIVTLTTATNIDHVSEEISFEAPKAPVIVAVPNHHTTSGDKLIAYAIGIDATNADIYLYNTDHANFDAIQDIDVSWIAVVDDV